MISRALRSDSLYPKTRKEELVEDINGHFVSLILVELVG